MRPGTQAMPCTAERAFLHPAAAWQHPVNPVWLPILTRGQQLLPAVLGQSAYLRPGQTPDASIEAAPPHTQQHCCCSYVTSHIRVAMTLCCRLYASSSSSQRAGTRCARQTYVCTNGFPHSVTAACSTRQAKRKNTNAWLLTLNALRASPPLPPSPPDARACTRIPTHHLFCPASSSCLVQF